METQHTERLKNLPSGSALFVCGAGGKTTLIHTLRDFYLKKGMRVVVATSTHMLNEGFLCETSAELLQALHRENYAFAGRGDPKNDSKIIAPSREVIASAREAADLLLIEADGSRCMPFKVPFDHEPVIWPFATCAAVLYGRRAAGGLIRDVCYNPEGVSEVLGVPDTTPLTEEMMLAALKGTYGEKLRREMPQLPVVYLAGEDAVFS